MSIYVVKFGASVLGNKPTNRNEAEKLLAITRQIKEMSTEHHVVAVVSAFQGVTDQRIAFIDSLHQSQSDLTTAERHTRATYIAQGEVESASILGFHLGAPVFNAWQIPLRTTGSINDADVCLDMSGGTLANYLRTSGDKYRIAVVTGYQGITSYDEGTEQMTLLGRGGSDMTAIALTAILRNAFKDQQEVLCHIERADRGVQTADPKRITAATVILNHLSYDELRVISTAGGGQLLQPRALALAKKLGINFTMGQLDDLTNTNQVTNSSYLTHVGAQASGRAMLGLTCSPTNDSNGQVSIALVGRNITPDAVKQATECFQHHGIEPTAIGTKKVPGVDSGLEIATFDVPNLPGAIDHAMQSIHKQLVPIGPSGLI